MRKGLSSYVLIEYQNSDYIFLQVGGASLCSVAMSGDLDAARGLLEGKASIDETSTVYIASSFLFLDSTKRASLCLNSVMNDLPTQM